jgi:hypothetical protein
VRKAFEKISAGLHEARAHAQGKTVKGLKPHHREIAKKNMDAAHLEMGLPRRQIVELPD